METWRLFTCASDTVTSGFTTYLPLRSLSAICWPACVGVRPTTEISPIIGKRMVPRSEMRASVVSSGLRKTVTRTMSPWPIASSCVAPLVATGAALTLAALIAVCVAGAATFSVATGLAACAIAAQAVKPAIDNTRAMREKFVSMLVVLSGSLRRFTGQSRGYRLAAGVRKNSRLRVLAFRVAAHDEAHQRQPREQQRPLARLRHRRHRAETRVRARHRVAVVGVGRHSGAEALRLGLLRAGGSEIERVARAAGIRVVSREGR